MIRFVTMVMAAGLLVGCASTGEWARPGADSESSTSQVALAQCGAWAEGITARPDPVNYMPEPAPTSYRTYGTYSQYGSSGSFQATTRANTSNFATGFNQGAALGGALVQAKRNSDVAERTKACMHELGWFDVSTEEGREGLERLKLERSIQSEARYRLARFGDPDEPESEQRWLATIAVFMDVESERTDGIDYRNDPEKMDELDVYQSFVEDVRQWGRIERAKLGLCGA